MSFLGTKFETKRINGINVQTIYYKNAPITIRFNFYAGSRFDKINGTAHLLEHLLVSSTKSFDSKDKIAEHLEKFGGVFSASVNSDLLRINIEIAEYPDFEEAIALMEEFIEKRNFNTDLFSNEKNIIISEIRSTENNPSKYVWELNRKNMFVGTPIENNNIGTEESVFRISNNDVYEHHEKYITANRLNIIIAGDIKENCSDIISKQFHNTIKEKLNYDDIFNQINLTENRGGIIEKNISNGKNAHVVCGITIPGQLSMKEALSINIFNNILGIGRGSRLLFALRYNEPIAYSAYSVFNVNFGINSLSIYFSSSNDNITKSLELIKKEISRIKSSVNKEEFSQKKTSMIKNMKREFQTTNSLVNFSEYLTKFSNDLSIDDYINKMNDLSLRDYSEVINKYIKEEKLITTICK